MKPFHVVDLNARGEVELTAEYGYALLQRIPLASMLIERCGLQLRMSPQEFAIPLADEVPGVMLRWRASAPTAGIATLWSDAQLASLSLLVSGADPTADQITLEAFQQHLVRELHDSGYEPAFDLMSLSQRPMVATVNINSPQKRADREYCAIADRCFAAAYFRTLGIC